VAARDFEGVHGWHRFKETTEAPELNSTETFNFASGQWTGFVNNRSKDRTQFDLLLQFRDNHLTGVGNDENGMFVLSGDYDAPTNECKWVQTYLFGTTVFYRGFCENKRIWGTWKSANERHGGFEIRPAPKSPSSILASSGC
jgi:hypothetical protein